ncbi:MAG: hypothetical protein R3E39_13895 [Anaerolineae bacterium]
MEPTIQINTAQSADYERIVALLTEVNLLTDDISRRQPVLGWQGGRWTVGGLCGAGIGWRSWHCSCSLAVYPELGSLTGDGG